jgi:hypothetical protein
VALVAFVERTSGSWEAKRKAWNAANPKAHYKDYRNLRRDCLAARRRLTVPTFNGIGDDRVAATRPDAPPQPVFFLSR